MTAELASQFRALIVGITGGIGSGKSTVAEALAQQFSVPCVDADQVARDVVAPGSAALLRISDYFGSAALRADGTLDRAWLRQQVFEDANKKQWLNELLHPLIRQQLLADLASFDGGYVLLMAPLLFENQLERYCDLVVVVDVAEQTQLQRATARDQNSPELIKAVMDAQISRADRLQKATMVIDNELPLSTLPERVAALHQQLIQLATKKLQHGAS